MATDVLLKWKIDTAKDLRNIGVSNRFRCLACVFHCCAYDKACVLETKVKQGQSLNSGCLRPSDPTRTKFRNLSTGLYFCWFARAQMAQILKVFGTDAKAMKK